MQSYEQWMTNRRDCYLMDLENEIVGKGGNGNFTDLKKQRIESDEWMELIRRNMDTGAYETDDELNMFFEYYKRWVLEGGGDEWFQERQEWHDSDSETDLQANLEELAEILHKHADADGFLGKKDLQ